MEEDANELVKMRKQLGSQGRRIAELESELASSQQTHALSSNEWQARHIEERQRIESLEHAAAQARWPRPTVRLSDPAIAATGPHLRVGRTSQRFTR